jgi:hypothetical protein
MHLTIIQLQRQSPPVCGGFQVSKNLAQSIFSIIRLHNDIHIKVSNVSSFNRLLQSLFTQLSLENPCSHIVVFAKLKLQSVPSRSCIVKIARIIGIWECLLECQDCSPTMFLCANCNHCFLWRVIFREAFTVTSGNFTKHIFVKCPPIKY